MGQNQWDVLSRPRFETDHRCIAGIRAHAASCGSEFFVFHQDSAPSHRVKDTIALLDQETPDFIPHALWPPNSPDLNPVEYMTIPCRPPLPQSRAKTSFFGQTLIFFGQKTAAKNDKRIY